MLILRLAITTALLISTFLIAALWLRSYWMPGYFSAFLGDERWVEITISDGRATVLVLSSGSPLFRGFVKGWSIAAKRGLQEENRMRLPAQSLQGMFPPGTKWYEKDFSLVPLLVFLALCSAARFFEPFRRHLRARRGLCTNCGYDPRGNVTSVCPECGIHLPEHHVMPRRQH